MKIYLLKKDVVFIVYFKLNILSKHFVATMNEIKLLFRLFFSHRLFPSLEFDRRSIWFHLNVDQKRLSLTFHAVNFRHNTL